jgi:hypothetical protein
MGKLTKEKIELDYTPNLTYEKMERLLALHFPEYPQVWPFFGEGIALKKRSYALCCVRVIHKEKKNRTRIEIFGSQTPLSRCFLGGIWYFFSIGDLVDQVEEVIRKELPNLIVD